MFQAVFITFLVKIFLLCFNVLMPLFCVVLAQFYCSGHTNIRSGHLGATMIDQGGLKLTNQRAGKWSISNISWMFCGKNSSDQGI